MRILFDGSIFDAQRFGGISRYIVETAKALNAIPRTRALVSAPLHRNEYLKDYASGAGAVRGSFSPPVRGLARVRGLANRAITQFDAIAFRPDVFHMTYFNGAWPLRRAAKRVITVYDMIYELFPEQFGGENRVIREKRIAVRGADVVICISECTRRDLLACIPGLDPGRVKVVYLGCEPFASAVPPEAALRAMPDRPYILFVGSRGGYKNFRCLLDAWKREADIRRSFDLLCFGGGEFDQGEREAISALGADAPRVRNLQGGDSLLKLAYENAAIFVYPSKYEGFGIPPLEAMHAGCPVICSDSSSIPEVVGGAGLYFAPDSAEDLGAKLRMALSDDALRARLVEAGRERLKLFTWENCARATLEAYGGNP